MCDKCGRSIEDSKVTLRGNHRDYTCECKRELQWDVPGTVPSREGVREGPARPCTCPNKRGNTGFPTGMD